MAVFGSIKQLLTMGYISDTIKQSKPSNIPQRSVLIQSVGKIRKTHFISKWGFCLMYVSLGFLLCGLFVVPVAYDQGYQAGAEIGPKITSEFEPDELIE